MMIIKIQRTHVVHLILYLFVQKLILSFLHSDQVCPAAHLDVSSWNVAATWFVAKIAYLDYPECFQAYYTWQYHAYLGFLSDCCPTMAINEKLCLNGYKYER